MSGDAPLTYRLLTGAGDRRFCERVSEALEDGYVLYGGPVIAISDGDIVSAQAVIHGEVDRDLRG